MLKLSLLASLVLSACSASTPKPPVAPAPIVAVPAKPLASPIDRAALRAKLAERRKITVEHFLAYRDARTYPINNLPGGGVRHVWQDDQGHLCAAATLISYDWGREASANVGKENREIALASITSGPLADWILTSGLTHHEIVAIQVPGSSLFPEPRPIRKPTPQEQETNRLFGIYMDVERQLSGLAGESLDEATDALLKRPDLARALLDGRTASAGKYAPTVAAR